MDLSCCDCVEKMADVGEDLSVGEMVEHTGIELYIGLFGRFRTVGICHTQPFEDGFLQVCGTGGEDAQ